MTNSPLATWAAYDAEHAIHDADRKAIDATAAARSLVLELVKAAPRDHFNACARLGGLLATAGASPSLVANTLDGAAHALSRAGIAFDTARLEPARASLLEGYAAGLRDAERAAARERWEYPACAVPVDEGRVAIACGYPDDDAEALAGWAARAAARLTKAKIRRAFLSGGEHAKEELAAALRSVGIEVSGPDAVSPRGRSWLRLPWRK